MYRGGREGHVYAFLLELFGYIQVDLLPGLHVINIFGEMDIKSNIEYQSGIPELLKGGELHLCFFLGLNALSDYIGNFFQFFQRSTINYANLKSDPSLLHRTVIPNMGIS